MSISRRETAQVIGKNLERARKEAKLTQTELADRIGRSRTLVSAAERGKAKIGTRYVKAVLEACGLPPNWPAEEQG